MANERITQISAEKDILYALTSLGNIFLLHTLQDVKSGQKLRVWKQIDLPSLHVPKVRVSEAKKISYGVTGVVKLTEEDYEILCTTYSKNVVDDNIEKMCAYLNRNSNEPYKDFKLALHGWIKRDRERDGIGKTSGKGRTIDN